MTMKVETTKMNPSMNPPPPTSTPPPPLQVSLVVCGGDRGVTFILLIVQ